MIPENAMSLLNYIGRHEADSSAPRQGAASGYDVVNNQAFGALRPPRPLSSMTLGEVKAWQRQTIAAQSRAGLPANRRTSAAGRYQFINATLERAQSALGLPDSARFDQATQDRLGFHLLRGRGFDDFAAGRIDASRFANNLAHEWAALPLVSGPNRGRGVYDARGFNASTGRADEWLSVVAGRAVIDGPVYMSARNMPGSEAPPDPSPPAGSSQPSPARKADPVAAARSIGRALGQVWRWLSRGEA
jgi:hypothetical protein